MMDELTVPQRYIWYQLLLMAGDSNIEGIIYHRLEAETRKPIGYNYPTLSDLICVELGELEKAIPIFIKHKKIRIDDLGAIYILNWEKYQSEYQRQKKYRQGDKINCNPSSNQSNSLDLDKDIELDKELKTVGDEFTEFWAMYRSIGNKKDDIGDKGEATRAYKALRKKEEKATIAKALHGYGDFLKIKDEYDNFTQRKKYASSWLRKDIWRRFIDYKYEPKL